jgi:hypothetical protein
MNSKDGFLFPTESTTATDINTHSSIVLERPFGCIQEFMKHTHSIQNERFRPEQPSPALFRHTHTSTVCVFAADTAAVRYACFTLVESNISAYALAVPFFTVFLSVVVLRARSFHLLAIVRGPDRPVGNRTAAPGDERPIARRPSLSNSDILSACFLFSVSHRHAINGARKGGSIIMSDKDSQPAW